MKPLVFALFVFGAAGLVLVDNANAQSTATYEVTFESSWSATTHPDDFPSNPHFSGLIGATHDSTVTFWAPDSLASTGMKNMAERGSKSALTDEINAAIQQGAAAAILSGGGISSSPGVVRLTFTVSERHPGVTLVSMLAPSPDWFVGVGGLNLFENGGWIDTVAVDLFVYDAGTDSGTSYTAPNQVADPPEPIAKFETAPFLVNEQVPPVGTFVFILQRVAEPTAVEEELPERHTSYLLTAAYPNPFTRTTNVSLSVHNSQNVRIALFDFSGRLVDTLFQGFLQAGVPRRISIQGDGLASGIYAYRVLGEDFSVSRTVVFVR